MKRALLMGLAATWVPHAYAETVWVQVRESLLRSQPKFYAPSVVPVRYGEKLEKVGESNGWIQARAGSQTGYLPGSAVSQDQIVLSAADLKKVSADSAEVVMAGKGFSKEVEQQYRSEVSGVRYDLVDFVEQNGRVSSAQVRQFIKDGGLKD